jgi:DNA-binding transcriptional ArsR family regulator
MATTAGFAEVAALAGDPARAAMLHALMDGRALTATELATVAGVAPQTASGHLGKLTEAGLLIVEKQGRHRYYRLASAMVAQMMESIMHVASALESPRKNVRTGPRDIALRTARTCYDHLAGRLGVALSDALVAAGHAEIEEDAGVITETGFAHFASLGIDLKAATNAKRTTRILCRPCLDWSERRPHLAGMVGAALCVHAFENNWIRRIEGTRAVSITPKGRSALKTAFGVEIMALDG